MAGVDRRADRTGSHVRFDMARAEGGRAVVRAIQHEQIDFLGREGQVCDGLESTAVSCQGRFVEYDVLVWLCERG